MNISATLDGESVTIVGISTGGSEVYITYVNSSDELKVIRKQRSDSTVIATDITIN